MFRKNADIAPRPLAVSFFRILHSMLFCYATAIICIPFFLDSNTDQNAFAERAFALAVGCPMMLCSLFFCFAATARIFFGLGIFFCAFLAFALAALPFMMNVFFPMHLVGVTLSGFYTLSILVLIRYFFSLPTRKPK